ncbi:hypothetical protein ACTWP5_06730 [Streptomyces sp. 4N509B]|uniref:hypothetical protein n=1 Tax=Streptomyces sp. 4N509B TaxID=3457413 RepID=UPI003FCF73DF
MTGMQGMLFSQMEPPPGREEEFHAWYDEEHIPARLAISGFAAASRYEVVDGSPRWLAVYELSDMAALATPEYRTLKTDPSDRTRDMLSSVTGFTRFTCTLVSDSGPAGDHTHLAVVAFAVPEEDEERFDDWYETEHSPLLLRAADWLRVRRYRVVDGDGGPWTHFAVHELASAEVMDSPERAAARRGPKRAPLAEKEWFGDSGRWLYRHHVRQVCYLDQ